MYKIIDDNNKINEVGELIKDKLVNISSNEISATNRIQDGKRFIEFNLKKSSRKTFVKNPKLNFHLSFNPDIHNQTSFLVSDSEKRIFMCKNGRLGGNHLSGMHMNENDFQSYYINNTSRKTITVDGVNLAILAELDDDFIFYFIDSLYELDDIIGELSIAEDKSINIENIKASLKNENFEKYKSTFVKTRTGQRIFRDSVLEEWLACPFTNIDNPRLLIASHIIPYAKCEGLDFIDADNGILLTPNFDKLFDKGFISFDENGKLIVSKELNEKDFIKFEMEKYLSVEIPVNEKRRKFLEVHREMNKI